MGFATAPNTGALSAVTFELPGPMTGLDRLPGWAQTYAGGEMPAQLRLGTLHFTSPSRDHYRQTADQILAIVGNW